MAHTSFKHIFRIVDHLVADATEDLSADNVEIQCRAGCNHCCHLLVEICWEEARELAKWLIVQPEETREHILGRLREAATDRKEFFARKKSTRRFQKAATSRYEIPEAVFDEYFTEKSRPCPFLVEGKCSAYEVRPTPCRLHLVSSSPELCAPTLFEDERYEVPERVEEAKELAGPIVVSKQDKGLYGELSILVLQVIEEEGLLESQGLRVRDGSLPLEEEKQNSAQDLTLAA